MSPEYRTRYTYHGTTSWGARRQRRILRRLLDRHLLLPPNGEMFEIGTGRGEFAEEAMSRGYRYFGSEPSRVLREALEQRGIQVGNQPVPPLPADNNSLDLVYSADVFEHLDGWEEAMAVCREAYRSLRPGGMLAVVAPNYDTTRWLFWAYEYQHTFVTNQGRLATLLRDDGFSSVTSREFLTGLGLTNLRFGDRLLCHLTLPVARSSALCDLLRAGGLETFLFRVHKNLCDHVLVTGRKPQ